MKEVTVSHEEKIKVAFLPSNERFLTLEYWTLGFTLFTYPVEKDIELREAIIQQQVNFGRIMAFVATLDESIVSDYAQGAPHEELLGTFDNNLMLLPNLDPITILAALHCKLNAIISDDSVVSKVSLRNDIDNVTYTYHLDENEEYHELPTMKDWLGDLVVFDTPWWLRPDDPLTWDRHLSDQEQVDLAKAELPELMEQFTTVFSDVEDAIRAAYSGAEQPSTKKPNVVKEGEIIRLDFD